jgi:hypothetical protein
VGLLGATAWLITTPAFAGSSFARCLNNTTIQCSGTNCDSRDESATQSGYCLCSSPNGSVDQKFCSGGGNY